MQCLEGLKVLDLTRHLSGPYCTMLLGDFGADVLKIEKPGEGDDQRKLGPFNNGESSPFMMINRNKRSMTLDLKAPAGRDIFLRLAKTADVIVENFRPGIVKSLGIDYGTVREINPAVVYCSISGYGQTGPYAHKGGFDILAQGMTGMMEMNTPVGSRPVKIPISLHDLGAGVTATYSILSAYICALKTGKGQYIDVSLVDAGLALTPQEASSTLVNGMVPKVAGSRNHLAAPYQAYRCKDGYVIVGAGPQKLWEDFCRKVIGRPEWIEDPRFGNIRDRVKHADALEAMLEEVLVQEDGAVWCARMDAAGVPGGPINAFDKALQDPHVLAREMVQEIEHPKVGRMKVLGIPAKLSETPAGIRRPAPLLGQHTEEVLRDTLGLSDSQIGALRESRVL